jgi:type IV secretory pathway TraG/TraD family ATPase VirD4
MGSNPVRIDELMSKLADDSLYTDYKSFTANDTKVKSGILATAKAMLSIFADEDVAVITSQNTFNFETLRKRKVALFVQNKVTDMQHYNILIRRIQVFNATG